MNARTPVLPFAVLALVVVVLATAPTAAAFAAPEDPVLVAYERADAPVLVALGALALDGRVAGGLAGTQLADTRFEDVPRVHFVETTADGSVRNDTFEDVTLVVHSGSVFWSFGESGEGVVDATVDVPYGALVTLPGDEGGSAEGSDLWSGLLLAGPDLSGRFTWDGAKAPLVLANATVSVLDATGQPVDGWDARRVNPGQAPTPPGEEGAAPAGVVTVAEGAFEVAWSSGALVASPGADAPLTVAVAPSPAPRYAATMTILEDAGGDLGGGADEGAGPGSANPLAELASVSDALNGAVLVFTPPGRDEPVVPREARIGTTSLDAGPFTLLRARDVTLTWDRDEVSVQGETALAFAGQGFAVRAPASLGPLPLVSLLLWAVAAGAIAYHFARRPGKEKAPAKWRLAAFATHAVVLVVAAVLWDASFRGTFGTSILAMLANGLGGDLLPALAVAALEVATWSLAFALFALPVRVVAGVALRTHGPGKGLAGFAHAAGLLVLLVLGPLYVLWVLNGVLGSVIARMPGLGG